AEQIELAVQNVLNNGTRTPDIMSNSCKEVSTSAMGDALISELSNIKNTRKVA
ncbi:MAG: 3-isopropylmalate dehydrogenase, partial [Alphaproteobacteria bacterium]|nr:3-isopropylmalate dehydrogenase [Alphaproteobacteria bacterium]